MPATANHTNATNFIGKVEVEATTTTVRGENESRLGIEVINASANVIYLGLGGNAKEKEGIYLAPNGGTWDGRVGQMVWTGSVTAICSVAKSVLTVVEV